MTAKPLGIVKGMRDKHQNIEEPDEVKVSCPVLKTNGVGDNLVEFNQLMPYLVSVYGQYAYRRKISRSQHRHYRG